MMIAAVAYLGVVAVASCASFAAYWLDKRRAVNGGRRVPENTLHLLAFLGGWPGALLAQRRFRHKTRKLRFQLAFWAVVVLHVAVVGAVAYVLCEKAGRYDRVMTLSERMPVPIGGPP